MNYKTSILGRKHEQDLIREYYQSPKAELVAVYGRRRVGKTYLVKQFFNNDFDFYFTGSFETPRSTQLTLFKKELERYSGRKHLKPKDWYEAFEALREYLSSLHKERIVVFLDELPWMDTPKSGFLSAFSYFWNSWASSVPGLKLFVCGSATTWMLSKLIGDKGGMHGRVNRQIYLRPFTLFETEQFLKVKGIDWEHYQVTEAYMTMGGIPYYLDMLEGSLSLNENIDHLFFEEGAALRTEYDFIFRSLFRDSKVYRSVVEQLATRSSGMSRKDIQEALKNNMHWKLIGSVKKTPQGVKASVKPVMLPNDNPLAGIKGAGNAIQYHTDLLGEITLVGPGAGRKETAAALIEDLIHIMQ